MKPSLQRHGSSRRKVRAQTSIGQFETLESRNLLAIDTSIASDAAPKHQSDTLCGPSELRLDIVCDAAGRYFLDPIPAAAALPNEILEDDVRGGAESVNEPLVDIREVPLLHSNQDAEQKIYLDFNGQRIAETGWNDGNNGQPIVAPAFDIDSDVTTFSPHELNAIHEIWARVAEDFAPFDIDVTTESPSSRSFREGGKAIRVLISSNVDQETGHKWFVGGGGVAYVDSWRWTSDTPIWVFGNNLGRNEKRIAEAASHEIGHALGLDHDGTTSGDEYFNGFGSEGSGWAPIMGAGYGKAVTQWSRGEYSQANNPQNDLRVITSAANGIRYFTDDHSFLFDRATRLERGTGQQVQAAGLIARSSDIDMFFFETAAGEIDIHVRGSQIGSNLDIEATLFDSVGNKIGIFNPTSSLSAVVRTYLPAGKYHLMIDGVGKGDPELNGYSEYGSIGRYTISGTLPSSETAIPHREAVDLDSKSESDEPPAKPSLAIVKVRAARRRLSDQVRTQVAAMILRSQSSSDTLSMADFLSLLNLLDEID